VDAPLRPLLKLLELLALMMDEVKVASFAAGECCSESLDFFFFVLRRLG
jgi:hypothetical protein